MSVYLTIDGVTGSAEFDDDSMAELIDVDELDVDDLARANGVIVSKDFADGYLVFNVRVDFDNLEPDLDKAKELIEKELEELPLDVDIAHLSVTHDYGNTFSFES